MTKESVVNLEIRDRFGFRVVVLNETTSRDTDFTPLKAAISQQIQEGYRNLAVSFSFESYLYSMTIAVLVQFLGQVKEHGGVFAIIHPNPAMLRIIGLVGLDRLIKICASEEELSEQDSRIDYEV